MNQIKVNIVNKSANALPEYQTLSSAGMDLRAMIEGELILSPLQRVLVGTGLYIELPEGSEAQIRPRSGLAYKHGLTVLNSPGTVDADYRGELKVLLVNLSNDAYTIKPGERIAQLVIASYTQASLIEVSELNQSDRDAAGFGSTGSH